MGGQIMIDQNNIKISITGDLGSGKSSVCDIIKDKYGFDIYSTGKIQRQIAERYNMTTLELNKYSETHPEIDREIDEALIKVGKSEGRLLLDSRMAWHFVPNSFKVFLKVDIDISAERVMNNQRGKVEQYHSHEEAKKMIMLRKMSENKRYFSKYGVDCSNMDNFDLVIDTSFCKIEIIADTIMQNLEKWCRGESYPKLWLSTKFIYPTAYINCFRIKQAVDKYPEYQNEHKNNSFDKTINASGYRNDDLCSVIENDNIFYIYGDHYNVSRSIMNHIDLIPGRVAGKDNELLPEGITVRDYVKQNYNLKKAMEWESCHGFKFPKYPEIK